MSFCERSWTKKPDGTIICKCPERAKPGPFNKKHFEDVFDEMEKEVGKRGGDISEFLQLFLRKEFDPKKIVENKMGFCIIRKNDASTT